MYGTLFNFPIRFTYLLSDHSDEYELSTKTFPENWDSKAPSVGTLLAYLETTA